MPDRVHPGGRGDLREPILQEGIGRAQRIGCFDTPTERLGQHRAGSRFLKTSESVGFTSPPECNLPLQGMSQVDEMDGSAPLEYSVPQ